MQLYLGDEHQLCPAGQPTGQRQIAGVSTHRLDEESALVGGGRILDAVDGVQDGVQRGVHTDGDVRAVDVVVDRGGHTDDGEIHTVKLQASGERAVAADDHESLDLLLAERAQGLAPAS